MVPSPVEGKKIIITAPVTYAPRLAKEIEEKKGVPLHLPTIETNLITPDDKAWDEMVSAVGTIKDHDWVLFTSRNGIRGVMFALLHLFSVQSHKEYLKNEPPLVQEQKEYLQSIFSGKKIAAIGKDAELLDSYGLKAELVPPTPSPQGIVDSLEKIYKKNQEKEQETVEQKEIEEVKCMVPAPIVREIPEPDVIPNFITALDKLGCQWTRFGCYVTAPTPSLSSHKNLELLKTGEIDMVAFSSTAEIVALLSQISAEKLKLVTKIGCFGPITAGNAEKNGVHVDMVAKNFSSFKGYAEEMETYFKNAE